MPSGPATENRFLTVPIGRLFLSNAVPMILVMSMGGLLNLFDAAFLGHYVGAEALPAVSLGFPAFNAGRRRYGEPAGPSVGSHR